MHHENAIVNYLSRYFCCGCASQLMCIFGLWDEGYVYYNITEWEIVLYSLGEAFNLTTDSVLWDMIFSYKDTYTFYLGWRIVGRGGSVVGFGVFRPESRKFESQSSRYVRTLGKSFTRSCPLRFGVITPTQYQSCSRERFWMAHAERSAMKWINTIQCNTSYRPHAEKGIVFIRWRSLSWRQMSRTVNNLKSRSKGAWEIPSCCTKQREFPLRLHKNARSCAIAATDL